MPFIEWNSSFAIGVGNVDAQHQELFRRVNELMLGMSEGRGRETAGGLVRFLEEYVQFHFGDEQAEMTRVRYPAFEAHVKEHQAFIADLAELRRALGEEGATASLTVAVNNRVCKWLVEHVLRADRSFSAFYKRQRAAQETLVASGGS